MGRRKKATTGTPERRPVGYSAVYGAIYRSTEISAGNSRPAGYSAILGPIGKGKGETQTNTENAESPDKTVVTDEDVAKAPDLPKPERA